jgi:hypothetical protein
LGRLEIDASGGRQHHPVASRPDLDLRAYDAPDLAGFRHVEVRTLDAPLRLASAAECTRFERESFGALHQMLSGLHQYEREAAWAEIEEAFGEFEGPGGFVGPCELIVAAGTK